MARALGILVVTLVLFMSLSSALNIYVKPTADTPCPTEPCLTLNRYAQEFDHFRSSNTTMILLPGEHYLDTDMEVANITKFVLLGESTSLSPIPSRPSVVCNGQATIVLYNITYLMIDAIELRFCGTDSLPAIQVHFVHQMAVIASVFWYSRSVSLLALGSCLTVTGSKFHNSSNTGLVLSGCTAVFQGRNFISNNTGGGIVASNSTIKFTGNTSFVSNSADHGGGILAVDTIIYSRSSITFSGNRAVHCAGVYLDASSMHFSGNTDIVSNAAEFGGGICAINRSSLVISGYTTFRDNFAIYDGGGLLLYYSTANCTGHNSFSNNAAKYGGGISADDRSVLNLSGSTFTNNSAVFGAGIHLEGSRLSCMSDVKFEHNLAEYQGGGLRVVNSAVDCKGRITFRNNMAQDGGGISAGLESDLILAGKVTFTNNSAFDGGGVQMRNSIMNFKDYITFENNVAQYQGGGIYLDNCTLVCNGDILFRNNTAYFGGGIGAAWGSDVTLRGSANFTGNSAMYGGGIDLEDSELSCSGDGMNCRSQESCGYTTYESIQFLNDSAEKTDHFHTILFTENKAGSGGGIRVLNGSVSITRGSYFIGNMAEFGGAITAGDTTNLTAAGTITMVSNSAKDTGGAILMYENSYMTFSGSLRLSGNYAQYGGGMFLTNSNLMLTGEIIFQHNKATYGGGIHGTNTCFSICGDASFIENIAVMNGGGMSLTSSSHYFLANNTNMSFTDNYAGQYGGAIFVADNPFVYCTSNNKKFDLWEKCVFQLQDWSGNINAIPDARCMLVNNTAGSAGEAVYGGIVDRCWGIPWKYESGLVFDYLFDITSNVGTHSVISSDPNQVCPCSDDGVPDCSKSSLSVRVYPGERFLVSVVAVGQRNGTVPALIQSSFSGSEAMLDNLQHAQSANNTCSFLYYTVFSRSSKETMTLIPDGPCLNLSKSLEINISLLPCPIGFALTNKTKGCLCEKRLKKLTENCNITSRKIDRNGEFWVGVDFDMGGIILHPHCPFDYCRSHPLSFTMNESDLQCNYNRTGLLCGSCKSGFSLVLGSSRCIRCSNTNLSLIVGIVIAGMVLVVFLLVCKLTVAVGTITGLVFYANIIAANHSVFFPSGHTNILTVFIAWLNLDLGMDTCFYDGLDVYTYTWLQFIFPLYVWILVGVIIFVSHYSSWGTRLFGSNPIAVLATLFLLAYTKLLRTIIAAFSFTFVEYPDYSKAAVWLYDGDISYLSGKHIPLFLAGTLALLLLFLPYTLLLFLGQWIQARSERRLFSWISDYRVKPFLDAYHAPFKNEHRYWPGLLLIIRCLLFLIFAVNSLGNPNVNLLAIAVCTTPLALLSRFTGRIYRSESWYLDALDVSFLLNIGIVASATLYVRATGGDQTILTYTSVSIAFLIFIGVLVYHTCMQIRDSNMWRNIRQQQRRQWTVIPTEPLDSDTEEVEKHSVTPSTTFIDLREMLLEDEHSSVRS